MAEYNQWMNAKVYEAASTLSSDAINAYTGAFFGSILGTLNHIVVGDTIWLKRFASHPTHYAELETVRNLPRPVALDQILFADFEQLAAHRRMLDDVIVRWAATIEEPHLELILHYASTKGVVSDKRFFSLVMHFFNHQTHHRGQVTTLLSQAGADVGTTDLLALVPNQTAE